MVYAVFLVRSTCFHFVAAVDLSDVLLSEARRECRTLDKLSEREAAIFVRCNTVCYRTL